MWVNSSVVSTSVEIQRDDYEKGRDDGVPLLLLLLLIKIMIEGQGKGDYVSDTVGPHCSCSQSARRISPYLLILVLACPFFRKLYFCAVCM